MWWKGKWMITVIMLAYDELENIQKAIQSFRLFCNMDISLIVIDNGSSDSIKDWAQEQTDFIYIYMDEEYSSWGKILNQVIKKLQINTDVLIMEGHYKLVPNYLQRMEGVLHSKKSIGAVGGVYNETMYHQRISPEVDNYGMAIACAGGEEAIKGKEAITLDSGAILWKKEAMDEIGSFEEEVESLFLVMMDYCIRAVMKRKKLMICPNAVLWKLPTNYGNSRPKEEFDLIEKKWGMHYILHDYNNRLIWQITEKEDASVSVLEIGCASGGTLLEIKNRYPNAKVFGTELNAKAAAFASHFAQAEVNNIEEKNLPFSKGMFDYIIFGDVLEHLHSPLEVLKYCKDFLHKGGCLVASIPNIMHISVIEQLLQGNFTYSEYGLLDYTHIHLFTYNEIVRMFVEAGYEILNIEAYGMPKIGRAHV